MNYQMQSSCDSSQSTKVTSIKPKRTIKINKKPLNIDNPPPSKVDDIISKTPDTTVQLKELMNEEKRIEAEVEKIHKSVSNDEKGILSHLGNYIEEPFHIIESYFQGQYLERLVRHQIESYNHFVNYQIQRTIQMFNPVKIHSDNDYVVDKDKYLLEILISFNNFKLYPPQIHENNGATKMMLPQEAKLRNFTYASTMTVDLNIQYRSKFGKYG
jgi:DNA-directed RNA polymerase beta subunit